MRGKRKDSASAAAKQLQLPDSCAATTASIESDSQPVRLDAGTAERGGWPNPEDDMLNDLVICLFMLSHVKASQFDWPGIDMSIEEAAKHHAMHREKVER